MDFLKQIEAYMPVIPQEIQDQKVILDYIRLFPDSILSRRNEFAHITSSAFIFNHNMDKALMVHHNIMNSWAWTGGHVDGEDDLLGVAVKEAKEESGLLHVHPLSEAIAGLDVLTVNGHWKNGAWVSSHLHLSVAFLLIADDEAQLSVKEDENSDVRWFPLEAFGSEYFDNHDVFLYKKLIDRGLSLEKKG